MDESNDALPAIRAFMDFYDIVKFNEFLNRTSAINHRGLHSPESIALGGAMEEYITYYNEKRIQVKLKGLAPLQARDKPFNNY